MNSSTIKPRLAGKIAVVSGGASGIGAETARQFAIHGASVVVTDVAAGAGEMVVSEIVAAGGTAMFMPLDVTDDAAWAEVVDTAVEQYGQLDVLANIAGVSGREYVDYEAVRARGGVAGGPAGLQLDDVTLDAWNRIMEVNSTGVFLGTRHAVKAMRRAGGGSIINISSICGIVGSFASAAYHASKGSVRLFTKAVAVEHAFERIRANSIHPGFVDTPMTASGHANNAVREARLAATPLGEFGQPYDIAMGCLYLASDESRWVTGTELVIDGGTVAV